MYKTITYTVNKCIDRIQWSLPMSQLPFIRDSLNNKFFKGEPHHIRNNGFIYPYHTTEGKVVQLINWSRMSAYGALIAHEPDLATQQFLARIGFLNLSQIELAWDFYPHNPVDLYPLKRTLAHHTILRNMRPGAFNLYNDLKNRKSKITQSHIHSCTAYTGRKGNIRKSNVGLKIYTKPDRPFVRLELNLNRQAIKRKRFTLPIDINDINLYDYITTRHNLNVIKLADVIIKGIKNADEYLLPQITSWLSCVIKDGPVIQQIDDFKQIDGIGYRVNEFFSETVNILDGVITVPYNNL